MLQRPSLPHTPGPQTPASPPHNLHPRASPLKPRKSPPPPLPHRTQARGRLHLRHMQVCRHRHPVTARKIRPRCRLATCKPRRDAIPTRYARPAMPPTHHAQAPPWRHPNTERKVPPSPTRRDATTARRTPHHAIPNTVRKTATATNDHNNGDDDGAAVGTVVMGEWDGGGSDGSDGEALLLLQTVHILSMQ